MLRIDAMPNYNNMAFKARFIKNEPLETALKNATEYDLLKFSKLLTNMERFDDGMTYQIYKRPKSFGSKDIQLELWSDNKANTSGGLSDLCEYKPEEKAYKGIIKKVNNFLSSKYPEEEVTGVKRETSMKRINKRLI